MATTSNEEEDDQADSLEQAARQVVLTHAPTLTALCIRMAVAKPMHDLLAYFIFTEAACHLMYMVTGIQAEKIQVT